MKVLVLGGSGATGKLVVAQLLKRKISTRILIRETAVIPEAVLGNSLLETVRGNAGELQESPLRSPIFTPGKPVGSMSAVSWLN